MKVVHILVGGNIGGIETLCKDYTSYSSHENVVLLLWGVGELAQEIMQMGIKVIILKDSKKKVLSILHKVADVCKNEHAEVLVAHHADPVVHLCLLYVQKKLRNIKTIAYAHANAVDIARTKHRRRWIMIVKKKIMQTSLKKADAVVAISNFVKKSLIEYFKTPEHKIRVIYNGTDIRQFKPKKDEYIKEKIELIYVGRLICEKGVQVILEGLSKFPGKERLHMSIIGDGPYRSELEAQAKALGLSNIVEFCGSRRDIPERLKRADYFIHMPVWEEGFGITIIEAMTVGLICICADSGAIPEIITDKVNGFIVKKDDSQAFAEALGRVVAMSDEDKKQISAAAVERAMDFSMDVFVSELDSVISSFEIMNKS